MPPTEHLTAAAVKAPPEKVPALVHNRIVVKTLKRADTLEQRMVDVIQPILEKAGREAAAKFRAHVTDHLTAAADGVTSTSTMIAVKPRPEEADAIVLEDGTPPDSLHVTLAYLGKVEGDLSAVLEALRPVAASMGPLAGVVGGAGFFASEGPTPAILLPDVPGLVELRVEVTEALVNAGIAYGRDHGFAAHLTVAYIEDGAIVDPSGQDGVPADDPSGALLQPLHFDALLVVRGDEVVYEIPLTGVPALTAAATPPDWTAPLPDQIIDVDALTAQIKAKTDPVRQAFLQAAMTPALAAAGIAFDITNPFTAKVLAGAGAHVKDIADTTQLNVMRIIRSAYDNGLSIPQTATAIQAGMSAASSARATLIARTELAGAVNGGSLAATQIVSDATGSGYMKRWLTAPGAIYPRHELYEGLDGQTVALDEPFDVGGEDLQYPGDADGSCEETCNCVPASTLVQMSGLRAAMCRRYEGDLVRVRTAAGDELAATPNHPVLRADGRWVPIGDVEEGDDLVRAVLVGDDQRTPDPDRPPAAIGEVYRLASHMADAEWVRLAPGDLHGDGADGEIGVVPVDGSLLIDAEAASDEQIEEFGFAAAAGARTASRYPTGTFRGQERRRHVAWTTSSGVRVYGEETALVRVETLHPEPVRIGARADADPHLPESAEDRRTAYSEVEGDLQDAVSAVVSLTKVVQVERDSFSGYVYNLDTGDGWYTAGSLLCRNCRCTLAYDDASGAGESGSEEAPDFTVGGDAAANATANADTAAAPFDTVSVGSGPPLPGDVIQRIKEFNLDAPLGEGAPTTDVGRSVYAEGKDTEALYRVGDQWTPERQALHEDIVAAHFAGKVTAAEDAKTAYFTAGGGASGKSRAIFDVAGRDTPLGDLIDQQDVIHIDPDRIKAMLPEYGQLKDANDLYAASGVHEESSALAKEVEKIAQERGYSYVLDTTGSSSRFLSKIETAKALGYDTKVTMFSIPTNEAIVRAMERGDRSGRYVLISALKSAHKGASEGLSVWKDSKVIDDWRVYDGTGRNPLLVAEGGKGTKAVLWDEQTFNEILAKAHEGPVSVSTPVVTPNMTELQRIMPGATLEHVQQVASSQIRKDFYDALAARHGFSGAEVYREKLDDAIAAAVSSANVRVRVTPQALDSILGDGRFKSQFESRSSGGMFAPDFRADAERTMFGYDVNLDPALRPIYGYLAGSTKEGISNTVRQYGDTIVNLKESARARTTFALQDSLGPGSDGKMVPQALVNPKTPSLAADVSYGDRDPLPLAQKSLRDVAQVYAEAQIHGGVTVNDIADVVFDQAILRNDVEIQQLRVGLLEGQVAQFKSYLEGVENPNPADERVKNLNSYQAMLDRARAYLALIDNDAAVLRSRLEALGIPYRMLETFDQLDR